MNIDSKHYRVRWIEYLFAPYTSSIWIFCIRFIRESNNIC